MRNLEVSTHVPGIPKASESLKVNSFPSLWKLAHVMTFFKKGDKSHASKYRPITLIKCVGKTLKE